MNQTTWTATRQDLVVALQKARVERDTARALLERLDADRALRLARKREERAAKNEQARQLAAAESLAAAHMVPPDPMAAYHRYVLQQCLTDHYRRKAS